jgi:hypothetical protein
VWPLVRDITANSKGRLEYAVDLRELCALVANQKADAVVCVNVSGMKPEMIKILLSGL